MSWSAAILAMSLVIAAATTSDAKGLRNKNNAPTVWVLKDADAMRRFDKVANAAVYDEAVIVPLLACKVPQGSKVIVLVLGSGCPMAYVRVVGGDAQGREGTVPTARLQDDLPHRRSIAGCLSPTCRLAASCRNAVLLSPWCPADHRLPRGRGRTVPSAQINDDFSHAQSSVVGVDRGGVFALSSA